MQGILVLDEAGRADEAQALKHGKEDRATADEFLPGAVMLRGVLW